MKYLKNNIDDVEKRISHACEKANRKREDVQLVAVSKTIECDIINESINLGMNILGESKAQEINRKYEEINSGVEFHLIGHLQTNKVKYIIDKVSLIHSVDSLKLANEINKRAASKNKIMKILLQVNISNEESKFGVDLKELDDLIDEISNLPNILINGLMFIAPLVDNSEDVRAYFKDMKSVFDKVKNSDKENISMEHLSMGMTNDFEIAIEEGATLIRVGTGIYGKRNYN